MTDNVKQQLKRTVKVIWKNSWKILLFAVLAIPIGIFFVFAYALGSGVKDGMEDWFKW